MINSLTAEEIKVLANYHMNNVEIYLHNIDTEISYVKKKPRINYIENTIDAIKREIEIVKYYTEKAGDTDENKS